MTKKRPGCIAWPEQSHTWDRNHSGMWVYAFWKAEYTEQADAGLTLVTDPEAVVDLWRDPFVVCEGPEHTLTLPLPAKVLSGGRIYPADRKVPDVAATDPDAWMRGEYLRFCLDAGVPLLGALCLGTTDKTYTDSKGLLWAATAHDLTRKGRKLVQAVSGLYGGREAHLVTYVDTEALAST